MNPEHMQLLINMLGEAGEGAKILLILYICVPPLLYIINWLGACLLVRLAFLGGHNLITRTKESFIFTEMELKIIRDKLNIGSPGPLTPEEIQRIKAEILRLIEENKP